MTRRAVALAMSLIGVGALHQPVSTQVAGRDVRATVHTLNDSIAGGAAGLSIDRMGVLYAGTFDDRVYAVRMDGRAEVFVRGQYGATGNVVGSSGELYQLNFHGGYVTVIDRHGQEDVLATGLETPMDVALAEGDLYVASCGSNAVVRVTMDGELTTVAQGPPFDCPNSITYASDGSLYVVNFSDARLLKVTLEGEVTEWGTLPHRHNVIASARAHLYVASGSGRQVHRVSLATGEVIHLAGSGERGRDDGNALEATFDWPNGIEATGEGKVFVNDLHSGRAGENGRVALNSGSVRLLTIPSLTEELISIYDSSGEDAMVAAYHAYRADEATAGLLDEAEVSGWGYATLPVLPAAAITIFRLNAESYPGSWRVHEALGDAYARTGRTAEAARAFERALELDPGNQALLRKLREVGRRN